MDARHEAAPQAWLGWQEEEPAVHVADRWDVPPILADESSTPPPFPRSAPPAAAVVMRDLEGQVVTWSPAGQGRISWVGTHGGCGVSSLATAAGDRTELPGLWPDPSLGWPAATVLVARTDFAGLNRLGQFLHTWSRGLVPQVRLVAVVVNADAPGRLPREIRDRITEISAAAPAVVTTPWVGAWRVSPYTRDQAMDKAIAEVMDLTEGKTK